MDSVSNCITYITSAGDTWDEIAYKMCGSEVLSSDIMSLNRAYMGVVEFGEGVELTIPVYEAPQDPVTLPPWRKADDS